ncbi:MAG: IPT/TIG domain-containing protein [Thermoanaerobaculia bacterium]
MATSPANPNEMNPESVQDQIPGNGPGEKPMKSGAIAWLAVYLFIITIGLLIGLYFAWSSWSDRDKPVKTASGRLEPSHGSVAGGTVVTITRTKPFPNPILHFDGAEVKSESVGDTGTVLRAIAPRHEVGPVIVDVVDKSTGKPVATFSYTYGQPFSPLLFLLVALAGGIGASLHALRSLYWYTGNRKAVESWLLMYLLLPWTGALMAIVFYLIISAGLMTPDQASNPLIAVGIAVIVGMFSREAAQKLENIADAVLTKASNGADAGKDSQATLQVITVDPPLGTTAGGDKVTVKGIGFSGKPTVLFDTAEVKSVTLTSPTSLTVVTPPHTAGTVEVTVKTATSSAKAEKAFTYVDGGVSPAEGPKGGGNNVTITGAGFIKDATTVTFGGTPAQEVNVQSETSLTAKSPAHDPGKVDVVVASGGKTVLTLTKGYLYKDAG